MLLLSTAKSSCFSFTTEIPLTAQVSYMLGLLQALGTQDGSEP